MSINTTRILIIIVASVPAVDFSCGPYIRASDKLLRVTIIPTIGTDDDLSNKKIVWVSLGRPPVGHERGGGVIYASD